jgi:SAM-dependent methyltransferase
VFGEVADTYDRVRPDYPAALFDAVFSFAGLRPGSGSGSAPPGASLCECGAGTGKATMLVAPIAAASGWSLTCVEPDPAMAVVLERKLSGVSGLSWSVVVSGLEDFADARATGAGTGTSEYSLVYAAQSWHWVSEERRAHDAASLLRDGGTLALIWNVARPHPPELQADLDRAYQGLIPRRDRQPVAGSTSAVMPPSSPQPFGLGPATAAGIEYRDELDASGFFEPTVVQSVPWTSRHETDEWLSILRTHSDHRMLDEQVLEDLLGRVGAVIDAHGGVVEVEYDAVAIMARRVAR